MTARTLLLAATLLFLPGCGSILVILGIDSLADDSNPPPPIPPEDTVLPVVALSDRPAPVTADATATFVIQGNKAGLGFRASLDGGAFEEVLSPHQLIGLADGEHTLVVRATDAAGRESTATYTWRVDTAAPGAPASLSARGVTPVSLAIDWGEALDGPGGSGVVGYRIRYGLVTSGDPAAGTGAVVDGTTQDAPFDVGKITTLTMGNLLPCRLYRFSIAALDAAGNETATPREIDVRTECAAGGVLLAPQRFAAGDRPSDLVAADLNADGILDLAVTNRDDDTVAVLLGNGSDGRGDGTFQAPTFTTVATGPLALQAADLNTDGILDLGVSHSVSTTRILIGGGADGRGDGSFTSTVPSDFLSVSTSIAFGDLDGDGILDGVGTNLGSFAGISFLGNGSGGRGDGDFTEVGSFTLARTDQAVFVDIVDFTREGLPDVLISLAKLTELRLLSNGGGGVFSEGSDSEVPVGDAPGEFDTGDFDGDGYLDVAVANREQQNGALRIFLSRQFGAELHFQQTLATGNKAASVVVEDFNSDAILDVAVCNAGSHDVALLFGEGESGRGNGFFLPAVRFPAGAGTEPVALASGDFNADGILDLATANAATDDVSILLGGGERGDPNGLFRTGTEVTTGTFPFDLVSADFTRDGIPDLACLLNPGLGDTLPVDENFLPLRSVVVVFPGSGTAGRPNGAFGPGINVGLPNSQSAADPGAAPLPLGSAGAMTLGHLGALGPSNEQQLFRTLDLVVVGREYTGTLLGRGTGEFEVSLQLTSGPARGVAIGRFNADDAPDLAVPTDFGLRRLLGAGGVFSVGTIAAGDAYVAAVVADVNTDALDDVVAINATAGRVEVHRGNGTDGIGDGTFTAGQTFVPGAAPRYLATGDFDRDGILDLAIANRGSDTVRIALGRGNGGRGLGSFLLAGTFAVGDEPVHIAVADFNRDAILDLAVANFGSDDVSVLLGTGANGRGDGGFGTPATYAAGDGPIKIAVNDFTGDGVPDLAVANQSGGTIRILEGTNTEE